jgi:hypothetical protein
MMASFAQPLSISTQTIGLVAGRFLNDREKGRIAAVFRSAFYIETGLHLVCVGTSVLEPGPLNLITSAPADTDWRAIGVHLHGPVTISASEIRLGHQFRFPTASAALWSPEQVVDAIDPGAVALGLAAFREAFSGQPVEAGIGRFIHPNYVPGRDHYECRAAEIPIAEARRWLTHAFTHAETAPGGTPGWIGNLTGLGAGLTPAGDDFLGGMMIALHALGSAGICRSLWSGVRPFAEKTTNAISLAFLRAASEGLGSASLHKALSGILRSDIAAVHDVMPGLGRIGHSSGWDTMTGIVTALDCWLQSHTAGVA